MITTRFFGGGASSVAINLVGGSIADIWKGPKGEQIHKCLQSADIDDQSEVFQ
jgi:hypothetical protein